MQPSDVSAGLTQLHDSTLKELFETIDCHKSALHDLVQQAQAELIALVGSPEQQVQYCCDDQDSSRFTLQPRIIAHIMCSLAG